jgi:hypothetical protein
VRHVEEAVTSGQVGGAAGYVTGVSPRCVTPTLPVPSPLWGQYGDEERVMRELPELRHPALAARGKHPILMVDDGSAASKRALAYAAVVP